MTDYSKIHTLNVREIEQENIEPLLNYWYSASPEYLKTLGADHSKFPSRNDFKKKLEKQIALSYKEKPSFALIWFLDENAVGHCNVNKIQFGKEAYMHLHLWNSENRKRKMGSRLVWISLAKFFNKLELETIYCEPYALNPAPNKTLEKIGFEFVKEYTTTPGYINFEQKVKRWKLSRAKAEALNLI